MHVFLGRKMHILHDDGRGLTVELAGRIFGSDIEAILHHGKGIAQIFGCLHFDVP